MRLVLPAARSWLGVFLGLRLLWRTEFPCCAGRSENSQNHKHGQSGPRNFLGGKSINQRKPLLWSGIAGQTEIWATKTTNNHFCGRGRSPRLNSGPTKPRTNTSEPFARAGGGFFAPICDQLKPFWPHRFPGQNHKKTSRRTSCTAQAWAKSGPRPPEPTRAQFPEGLLAGVWRFGPAPPVRESRIRGLSGKASGRTRNPGMARLSAMGRRL